MTGLALDAPVRPVFLHPGEVGLGHRGDRFETLLGSCVAIVLTDPRRTVAAICHFVHANDTAANGPDSTAHAGPAVAWMFAALRAEGIEPTLCEAFVFGGGNMFPRLVDGPHIGDRNVDWALRFLKRTGLRIRRQDTGGSRYRRLGWTIGCDEPEVMTVDV
jgi:chemotaxis protein CheD